MVFLCALCAHVCIVVFYSHVTGFSNKYTYAVHTLVNFIIVLSDDFPLSVSTCIPRFVKLLDFFVRISREPPATIHCIVCIAIMYIVVF